MHFCEPLGTFGAKCGCVTGYRLTDDGLSCQPESICISFDEAFAGGVVTVMLQFTFNPLYFPPH